MRNILAPSILAADFWNLGENITKAAEAGAEYIHFDVMDGWFVPTITFGMTVLKSVRSHTNLVLDVHLMMEEPERYIDDFVSCGADILTIHAEACPHLDRALREIKKTGVKACLALCPATSLSVLDYLWNHLDMILVMTVNPGFGGQPYIPEMTGKIAALRKKLEEMGLQKDIEVDGGINDQTIHEVLQAGANVIVAGSAVFHGDIGENVKRYLGILKSYEREDHPESTRPGEII